MDLVTVRMSVVNTSATLGSLEEGFANKIEALKICTGLRDGWAEDTVIECSQLTLEIKQLQRDVEKYRSVLAQAKRDVKSAHRLIQHMQGMCARLTHMKENIPVRMPLSGSVREEETQKKAPQNKDVQATAPVVTQKAAGKVGGQKTKQIKMVQFITVEEFESVPKYIRGRLQYDQVNESVSEVNRALEAKYTLMAKPRNKLSESDMTIVRSCKYQENKETKGVNFVVTEDIKRWSALRMDASGRSLLTILRTLRRIKEIRGPGAIVRFAPVGL